MSKKDIPSMHEVSSYLHNEYSDWMSQLKEDIKVCIDTIMLGLTTTSCAEGSRKRSCTADTWTADNTKASFLGITVHWIDVVDRRWQM